MLRQHGNARDRSPPDAGRASLRMPKRDTSAETGGAGPQLRGRRPQASRQSRIPNDVVVVNQHERYAGGVEAFVHLGLLAGLAYLRRASRSNTIADPDLIALDGRPCRLSSSSVNPHAEVAGDPDRSTRAARIPFRPEEPGHHTMSCQLRNQLVAMWVAPLTNCCSMTDHAIRARTRPSS
jgi:hypothetical protein